MIGSELGVSRDYERYLGYRDGRYLCTCCEKREISQGEVCTVCWDRRIARQARIEELRAELSELLFEEDTKP